MSEFKDLKRPKVDLGSIIEAETAPKEKMEFLFSGKTSFLKKKAYMAGKLFNDADRAQREKEYKLLIEANRRFSIDIEVFSPMYAPINDKSTMPTSLDIFNGDESPLMSSDVVFADLSDFDPGVMMEIGMIVHKNVSLYAYLPDIRIQTAGEYKGIHVPFGSNQFVIGGIEKHFGKVYSNFDQALEAYIRDHAGKIVN